MFVSKQLRHPQLGSHDQALDHPAGIPCPVAVGQDGSSATPRCNFHTSSRGGLDMPPLPHSARALRCVLRPCPLIMRHHACVLAASRCEPCFCGAPCQNAPPAALRLRLHPTCGPLRLRSTAAPLRTRPWPGGCEIGESSLSLGRHLIARQRRPGLQK